MDPYLAEIRAVGFNFAPQGWALCNGQILPINQNTALFSLLGTQFGGNGTSNFALPDLGSRIPVGQGQGPGLTDYVMGEMTGVETVGLNVASMASHTHSMVAQAEAATSTDPTGHLPALTVREVYGPISSQSLASDAIAAAGGGVPHPNIQPSLGITYIIALQGIFPPHQ